jgi:hypothetical protein
MDTESRHHEEYRDTQITYAKRLNPVDTWRGCGNRRQTLANAWSVSADNPAYEAELQVKERVEPQHPKFS